MSVTNYVQIHSHLPNRVTFLSYSLILLISQKLVLIFRMRSFALKLSSAASERPSARNRRTGELKEEEEEEDDCDETALDKVRVFLPGCNFTSKLIK